MNAFTIARGILLAVLYIFLIALGIYSLFLLKNLISYIVIAAITSLIGRPITVFLKNKLRFNNTFSVVMTITFLVLVLFGLIALFIPLIIQQSENLSLLDVNALESKVNRLFFEIASYFHWQETNLKNWILEKDWMNTLNLEAIPNFLNTLLDWLSGFTIGLFSVLFISFFLLKDAKLLEKSILLFIDNKHHSRLKESFERIKNLLSRYFIGLVFQISILFIFYSIILGVFGVKNAFIIAFLCALLNLIPYIGPMIGGLLMLVLSMTSNLEADFSTVILPQTIYVMIGFTVGQLIDNFFSQPFIFSTSVKSHPLEIFIVILMSGFLFGILGLVFAIPLYTSIKVIFKTFYAKNKFVQSLTKNI